MTVYAGNIIYASDVNDLSPIQALKLLDESVNNGGTGTTLQNDNELTVSGRANTNYSIIFGLLYTEAAGTGIDIKCAWTQPSGCTLNLANAGPNLAWTGAAAAAEAEWSAWQNQTGTTTGTISFGSTNAAALSVLSLGSWKVGATAGSLQFQWAQQNSSASNLTVKAGSVLIITPVSS
jgi:hypothetical protein